MKFQIMIDMIINIMSKLIREMNNMQASLIICHQMLKKMMNIIVCK